MIESKKIPLQELIYSPDPAIWHPWSLLKRMAGESWRFRELVRRLVVRDIQAQYRQSLLGYFWAFVPSLGMAAGFTLARNANILHISDTHIPYPAFVLVGTILWQTFIESLNGPIETLHSFRSVIGRIYLPPEIIIFAKMGEILINLFIKLFLLAAVIVIYSIPINTASLLAPIVLVLLILEGMTLGLLLAPLSGLYQDVSKGLAVVTGFWFLLTPVVYPTPNQGLFSFIVKLNPATLLLTAARDLAIGAELHHIWPVFWMGIFSVVGFVFALIAFRISIPFIIEKTSS